jgi:hypothetical protein
MISERICQELISKMVEDPINDIQGIERCKRLSNELGTNELKVLCHSRLEKTLDII